ncbi:MAG TPA: hypothetical protein VFO16_22430 [Pseudonocardiaceae bacterium]|nr:hypothetical protein [Pseudonocardiaceae bacterium]
MSTDPPTVAAPVHLLAAGELFRQGYPSTGLAVCGQPVTSGPDIEEPRYCSDCVEEAIRWSAQP